MTAPTDADLLPCPFCGRNVSVLEQSGLGVIVCNAPSPCLSGHVMMGFAIENKVAAIAAWNRRAALTAMPRPGSERADALEEAAKVLDAEIQRYSDYDHPATRSAIRRSAATIRALKDKPLPPPPEKADE